MPPARTTVEVRIDGRRLTLSNLDKVLYPATGFRKADVIAYYQAIAPALLPHLEGRPLTLVRAPNGEGGQVFFEKRVPPHAPAWVRSAPAPEGSVGVLCDDLPTLVWIANLAALELHVHQARADAPERPTAVVLDLDPGAPATIVDCCRVALELRDVLGRLDLDAVVKTSGSKGLHLSIPLNGGDRDQEATKAFALALGQVLERRDPSRVTTTMAKAERPGKVFVDWSQNDRHKTTVAPYSLRIRPRPWASTPLQWDEVVATADDGDHERLVFEASDTVARVAELGDLYAPALTLHQQLPSF